MGQRKQFLRLQSVVVDMSSGDTFQFDVWGTRRKIYHLNQYPVAHLSSRYSPLHRDYLQQQQTPGTHLSSVKIEMAASKNNTRCRMKAWGPKKTVGSITVCCGEEVVGGPIPIRRVGKTTPWLCSFIVFVLLGGGVGILLRALCCLSHLNKAIG
ncbi:hypothetical protein CDAR_105901 [Caerostris darwini]|uniref:Uncharacterized protein n=1 Tax=Caerostris darwini TaxID=1538125 RepID=A0AAV4TQF3_9ARAC|nr:hypothetical protein CDAR_105901 [Caerostris darwini]